MYGSTFAARYVDGTIGVCIFFVISGFLITTLLLRERIKNGRVSLRKFFIRRALRIMPVACLYLVVLVMLNLIFNLNITAKSFVTAFLYLKNLPFKDASSWYDGHFWSLAVEEQFYLVFPFLLLSGINRYLRLVLTLIIIIPILAYFAFNNIGIFYTNAVVHRLVYVVVTLISLSTVCILVGSVSAILMFKGLIKTAYKKVPYFLSLFLLILAYFTMVKTSYLYIDYFCYVIFSLLIGAVIILNLNADNFLTKILSTKLLSQIGIISYSIYIWQQLFTQRQPWAKLFPYADSLWLNIPAMIMVSLASYYLFEKRFIKLKKKYAG